MHHRHSNVPFQKRSTRKNRETLHWTTCGASESVHTMAALAGMTQWATSRYQLDNIHINPSKPWPVPILATGGYAWANEACSVKELSKRQLGDELRAYLPRFNQVFKWWWELISFSAGWYEGQELNRFINNCKLVLWEHVAKVDPNGWGYSWQDSAHATCTLSAEGSW